MFSRRRDPSPTTLRTETEIMDVSCSATSHWGHSQYISFHHAQMQKDASRLSYLAGYHVLGFCYDSLQQKSYIINCPAMDSIEIVGTLAEQVKAWMAAKSGNPPPTKIYTLADQVTQAQVTQAVKALKQNVLSALLTRIKAHVKIPGQRGRAFLSRAHYI